jgi:hypothetical protein
MRNGASASLVTIHGETKVDRLLARKGPRGWDSQAWMSRADRSFSRQKPAMCRWASAMGNGLGGDVAAVEDLTDASAQGLAGGASGLQKRVQGAAGSFCGVAGGGGEQPGFERGADVEDAVADGNAAAGGAALRGEHTERKVLDGE